MVAISHMWLFKYKLIKIKHNLKFSTSVALATFQVLSGHMHWTAQTQNISIITKSSLDQCGRSMGGKKTPNLPASVSGCRATFWPFYIWEDQSSSKSNMQNFHKDVSFMQSSGNAQFNSAGCCIRPELHSHYLTVNQNAPTHQFNPWPPADNMC